MTTTSFLPSMALAPTDRGLLQSPRMQKLLHSNEFPSQQELTEIVSAREDCAIKLLDVDGRLAKSQAVVLLLENEKELILGKAAKYAIISHPIRRTPPEILSLIFLQCIAHDIHWSREDDNPFNYDFLTICSLMSQAMKLSQVCSQWRVTALSLPALWSLITVNLDSDSRSGNTSRQSLLRLILERSASKALSVCVQVHGGYADRQNSGYIDNPLLNIAFSSSSRWESLNVVTRFDVGWVFLAPLRGAVPLLKNLHISHYEGLLYNEGPEGPVSPFDMFEIAPSLRVVRSSLQISDKLQWLMPLSQLRNYVCGGVDPFPVLLCTPDLESCDMFCYDWEKHPPPKMVVLPKLWALTMRSSLTLRDDPDPTNYVVDRLKLPSLTDLKLDSHNTLETHTVHAIISLLGRSHCSLRQLKLSPWHTVMSSKGLQLLLEACPSLEGLSVNGTHNFSDELLRRLIYMPGVAVSFLPHLSHLVLYVDYTKSFSFLPSLFAEMVSSRWRFGSDKPTASGARLTHVKVPAGSIKDQDAVACLKECLAEGLSVAGI